MPRRVSPGGDRPRAWSQVPPGQRRFQDERLHRDDGGQQRYGPPARAPARAPIPDEGRERRRGWAPAPAPAPVEPPPPAQRARRRRRFGWGKRLGVLVVVLVLLIAGFTLYLDSKLNRVDALASYPGRPAATAGSNWLLVGSDSRAGLTEQQRKDLSTGDAGGGRTDTIMVLHRSSKGPSTLVSIPRDSYLPIPGHGKDKLNAAFAIGGPTLLVQSIEQATGLRMDHYAEVGFGGFAGVVDAVGGVDLCLDQALDDPAAGINLPAGCQHLDGAQALGFVRSRHLYANQDISRIKNQRKFLTALLSKATSPTTAVNPFRVIPLATRGVGSLTVDSGDHVWNLVGLGRAIGSGDLVNTTVPIAGTPTVDVGSVVAWDTDRARAFFGDLAADRPLPPDLITTG